MDNYSCGAAALEKAKRRLDDYFVVLEMDWLPWSYPLVCKELGLCGDAVRAALVSAANASHPACGAAATFLPPHPPLSRANESPLGSPGPPDALVLAKPSAADEHMDARRVAWVTAAAEAESERRALLQTLTERNSLDIDLYRHARSLALEQLRAAGVQDHLPGEPNGPPAPPRESCAARLWRNRRKARQLRQRRLAALHSSSTSPQATTPPLQR